MTSTPLRQAHAGDLAEGGVRLLRGGRVDAGADATALRGSLQGRRLGLRHLVLAALADQLVDGGHRVVPFLVSLSQRHLPAVMARVLLRERWCPCARRAVRGRGSAALESPGMDGLGRARHEESRLLGRPEQGQNAQAPAPAAAGRDTAGIRCGTTGTPSSRGRRAGPASATPAMVSRPPPQQRPAGAEALADPADHRRADRGAAHEDHQVERHHPPAHARRRCAAACRRWRW